MCNEPRAIFDTAHVSPTLSDNDAANILEVLGSNAVSARMPCINKASPFQIEMILT